MRISVSLIFFITSNYGKYSDAEYMKTANITSSPPSSCVRYIKKNSSSSCLDIQVCTNDVSNEKISTLECVSIYLDTMQTTWISPCMHIKLIYVARIKYLVKSNDLPLIVQSFSL